MTVEILNAKQIQLTDDDISSIVKIECHAKVQDWLYDSVNLGLMNELRDYHEFFKNLPKNWKADILIAKCDGRVVGFLGMWRLGAFMEHVATIGVSVHPNYWGMGIGTNLIESAINLAKEKGIERLEVETLSENAPLRSVAEKAGFELESIRKKRIMKGGVFHDEATYFMLL
jgi:RimJ/RimL family protein N-acetyltransferase